MELYIKAGPKDGDVGDCPFAHYVRCVLNYKKLEYKSLPCKPDSKPDWLIKELEGKMPCLKQGNLKMVHFTFYVHCLLKTVPCPSSLWSKIILSNSKLYGRVSGRPSYFF